MESLLNTQELPDRFEDEEALEAFMTQPSEALVSDLNRLDGDIMVLGVGGKMGPTLARLAKRAAPEKRVIGVARFSDPEVPKKLESWGIETEKVDLLDREAVIKLPQVKNIVYMAGRKFGTTKPWERQRTSKFVMAIIDGLIERPLTLEDIPGGLALSREAGWNQTSADWQLMLTHGQGFGLKSRQGQLVATALTLPHGNRLAWISMVLVTASHRKKGLATHLLQTCINSLSSHSLAPPPGCNRSRQEKGDRFIFSNKNKSVPFFL